MPCKGCGLRGVNKTLGQKWIECWNKSAGMSDELAAVGWSSKSHGKLYAYALEPAAKARIEADYPALAPIVDPGFGSKALYTAQLAAAVAKYSTAFWSCMGISARDGAAQVVAQSGEFYEATMAALGMIYNTEDVPVEYAGDGPAAVALLIAGSLGSIFGLGKL